jgi:hypothetical protein
MLQHWQCPLHCWRRRLQCWTGDGHHYSSVYSTCYIHQLQPCMATSTYCSTGATSIAVLTYDFYCSHTGGVHCSTGGVYCSIGDVFFFFFFFFFGESRALIRISPRRDRAWRRHQGVTFTSASGYQPPTHLY